MTSEVPLLMNNDFRCLDIPPDGAGYPYLLMGLHSKGDSISARKK
jgi:hypothetical protein